jgi:hypothetical protein
LKKKFVEFPRKLCKVISVPLKTKSISIWTWFVSADFWNLFFPILVSENTLKSGNTTYDGCEMKQRTVIHIFRSILMKKKLIIKIIIKFIEARVCYIRPLITLFVSLRWHFCDYRSFGCNLLFFLGSNFIKFGCLIMITFSFDKRVRSCYKICLFDFKIK